MLKTESREWQKWKLTLKGTTPLEAVRTGGGRQNGWRRKDPRHRAVSGVSCLAESWTAILLPLPGPDIAQ
jgi:hypothetical protein